MSLAGWLKAFETLTGLAEISKRVVQTGQQSTGTGASESLQIGGKMLGQIEARLAGVVMAALKEAFDRDRDRMELERSHIEAERQRAERAFQYEVRRQRGERDLTEARLITMLAAIIWLTSTVLISALPASSQGLPLILTATGWVLLIAAVTSGFVARSHVGRWLAVLTLETGHPATDQVSEKPLTIGRWTLVAAIGTLSAALFVQLLNRTA